METVKRSKACGKISITVSLTLKPGPRFVLLVNTNCKKNKHTPHSVCHSAVITQQQDAQTLH